ncbi:MAG: carbamoyl-phosphate synthase large subunit [Desulfobacteraceae bacterium]|nr:carbamoyl-phosphate synthase large subunit [Desulfobacteraceae bacterium]
MEKILVANRGEIAVRIIRAAAELRMGTVAVFSEDDRKCLHTRFADQSVPLQGLGAAAYLDADQIIAAARDNGCMAIAPGYGFLSENTQFAEKCQTAGIAFIGPTPESLELFGNKALARQQAQKCNIALLPATHGPVTKDQAREFFKSLGEGAAVMIKALAGGGGRGMRSAYSLQDLDAAFDLCCSEAEAAFGCGDVYVEKLIADARHIEVQVIGDGRGGVSHLWERECTLQRRNQKLVEIAPAPGMDDSLRTRLTDAAVQLAQSVDYRSLGTFEFLVDAGQAAGTEPFYFLEVNPRLQVEHTVTEEITGVDLVRAQIEIARGRNLADLGLCQEQICAPAGHALQLRINMEEISENGDISASAGTLRVFEPPLGPGVRVDTFGYAGYEINPNFDSLLAKLICHSRSPEYADVLAKAYRALCEFRIEGVATNIGLLQNLVRHPDVVENKVTTRFVETQLGRLTGAADSGHRAHYFDQPEDSPGPGKNAAQADDANDAPENTEPCRVSMPGTVVKIEAAEGQVVHEKQVVAVIEAMKMQHAIEAGVSGVIRRICVKRGDTLARGRALAWIEPGHVDAEQADAEKEVDLDHIRPDLAEVADRHRACMDEARPEAVEKRRKTGQRTARENIADLVDDDSFIEYGALAVAAQRRRRSLAELIKKSPADGLITGIGSVNGNRFDETKARCMVLAYDYTAMAGTQGAFNHQKTDRMLHLAEQWRLPVVLFAEGGGGRPGDVDAMELRVAGLDLDTFTRYAALSGLVPVVGIVSGYCFAGNATLLGCSDVIIATKNANIGMGGPAMIEGGGLGKCRPEQIGPASVQGPNGVIDILVEDEAGAVAAAKKYLSYFQGPVDDWQCADQRRLRRCVPENRLRAYNVSEIILLLADTDSVTELRGQYGTGIVTALIRIQGRPFGLMANNCWHLGGAIDGDAADKAARFMKLCDAFDIPMVVLCDTPGFMVGPEAEKSAQVRRFARLFVTAAGATIPVFSVVLRKGYGLGAMAMVGGGYHRPVFNIAWPTGEFGGMGLEGAVKLGFKKDLEAEKDPEKRQELYDSLVAMSYEHGKAINMASFLEIDDVIDPADTRHWIMRGLAAMPPAAARTGKKRPDIDTW